MLYSCYIINSKPLRDSLESKPIITGVTATSTKLTVQTIDTAGVQTEAEYKLEPDTKITIDSEANVELEPDKKA